jgi:2-hydroxychromene-2-carboxylate isomerase
MPEPIRLYLDFASPYAYFALPGIERLAAAHGRAIDWRPVLVWAVLKAQKIAPPMEAPARLRYFLTDMARSAAFHGLPYRQPSKFPISAHRAARLYYAMAETDPGAAQAFGKAALAAFFTRDADITSEDVLVGLAEAQGIAADVARAAIDGPTGRERLAAMIDMAVADGVTGSPFFIVDGEPFFGADRLPQIEWRLSGTAGTSIG